MRGRPINPLLPLVLILLVVAVEPALGQQGPHPLPYTYDDALRGGKVRPKGAGTPPGSVWDWGELTYDRTYRTKLFIENACSCTVEVQTETHHIPHGAAGPARGLSYLEIPSTIAVPPGGTEVDVKIVTPPAPTVPPQPLVSAIPHPIYTQVEGWLVLDSKFRGCCPNSCPATIRVHYITGHIHVGPDSDPQKVLVQGLDCTRYWVEEVVPPPSEEEMCVGVMRDLAREYVRRDLDPYRREEPRAWRWLPSDERIDRMSIGEILELKFRAEALRKTARATAAVGGSGSVP